MPRPRLHPGGLHARARDREGHASIPSTTASAKTLDTLRGPMPCGRWLLGLPPSHALMRSYSGIRHGKSQVRPMRALTSSNLSGPRHTAKLRWLKTGKLKDSITILACSTPDWLTLRQIAWQWHNRADPGHEETLVRTEDHTGNRHPSVVFTEYRKRGAYTIPSHARSFLHR